MSPSRLSYLKTAALSPLLGVLGFALALTAALELRGIARAVFVAVGSLLGLIGSSGAVGAILVMERSRGLQRGCDADHVAERGVLHLGTAADRPDQGRARLDADPQRQPGARGPASPLLADRK